MGLKLGETWVFSLQRVLVTTYNPTDCISAWEMHVLKFYTPHTIIG